MVLLLLALILGVLSPTPPASAARTLTVAVRDLAGQPVSGVTLKVTAATVPTGVTAADGTVQFAVAEDALTITDAHLAGRALLLDRTSAAGLRVPVADVPVTLELWLADGQLFVPPAGGGPVPDDLAAIDTRITPTAGATQVPTAAASTPELLQTAAQSTPAAGAVRHATTGAAAVQALVFGGVVVLVDLLLVGWVVPLRLRRRRS